MGQFGECRSYMGLLKMHVVSFCCIWPLLGVGLAPEMTTSMHSTSANTSDADAAIAERQCYRDDHLSCMWWK